MRLKSRRTFIYILLLLSFVVTSGTFAYWATTVEGTSSEAVGTLQIGSGDVISTRFQIENELHSGGLLVPAAQIDNSLFGAVDSINIIHSIAWNEVSNQTQLTGTETIGLVGVQHRLKIVNGEELTYEDHEHIFNLVVVEYDVNNPTTLTLNSGVDEFSYHIRLNEPKNQEEYTLIANATITVEFLYTVNNEDITTSDYTQTVIDLVETSEEYFYVSSSTPERIRSYDIQGGLDVVIPKEINGETITVVGNNSFLRKGINSIVLQEGIERIGTNGFHSNNLEFVQIPKSVRVISYNAFNRNQLTSINLQDGLEEIRAGAFANNALTEVHLPSTVTEVGSGAFGYGNNFITVITIGDNVEIGNSASFGWYGSSFISMYNNNPIAGTYVFSNGVWNIQ